MTGGTGFIGSHLVRRLVKEKQDVVAYDFFPNVSAIADVVDKVAVVRGDILDPIQLVEVIKRHNVEYVVHLAYLLLPESGENPTRAVRINCEGTNVVFDVAKVANIKRVVWASSIAVYGPSIDYGDRPVNEDDSTRPITIYGACKLFNEQMGQHYCEKLGVDNIGLRFTYVYGPGRITGETAFVSDLIEKPALGEPAKIPHGDSEINWQYVKDAVNAIVLACRVKKTEHRIFNTCGQPRSVREAADYIKKLLPEAIIDLEPGCARGMLPMRIDITRARRELGYEPSYTMEKGIKEYINVIRVRAGLQPL